MPQTSCGQVCVVLKLLFKVRLSHLESESASILCAVGTGLHIYILAMLTAVDVYEWIHFV